MSRTRPAPPAAVAVPVTVAVPAAVAVPVTVALPVAVALLVLGACSGPASSPGRPAGSPSAVTATSSAPAVTPTSPPPAAATTGTGAAGAPRPAADSVQQQITALSTAGGVPSLVVRLTASGTVPGARTVDLVTGQTLRVIVVSPVGAHLTGPGIGVDLDVPAGSPTAVDVVAFTPGAYVLATRDGAVVLRARVRG